MSNSFCISLEVEQIIDNNDIIAEYEGIDKSIIEVIYMEGNTDIDPLRV